MNAPVCYFTTREEAETTLAQLDAGRFEVAATTDGYELRDNKVWLPVVEE